jgi:signal transduction histidine kinase/DNA-binding response OmpR family regulator
MNKEAASGWNAWDRSGGEACSMEELGRAGSGPDIAPQDEPDLLSSAFRDPAPSPDIAATVAERSQRQSDGLCAFLAGGGEMGALVRAMDWSQTAVGAIESWPQSLKTAVSICLGSRHPMVVWWGQSAYTQFYNDAYISFLGRAKHPGSLGRSGRDCWSEIWPVIGPMLEGVYATGEATWSEDRLLILDRNLPKEEGYFTFSYSPIRDDRGAIGGIFCACNETTARVIGERRLRTLRDLNLVEAEARTPEAACQVAARILAENPGDIPFALIYLIDDGGREAQLIATAAVEAGSDGAPQRIGLNDESEASSSWPLAQVLHTGMAQLVSNVSRKFGTLPGGRWPEPCEAARIMPIAAPGQTRPTGFLVTGLSPRRVIDGDYESFLNLVAGHIGTSIAGARAYEEECRRAEALAAIDRAKTAFFSNVSHEFRTPLTLMLGPLEDALASPADALPRRRADLALVHRNGLRLLRLVNTLLDFSRIEAGRVQASYEPVDLAAFTAELASVFRAATEKAGIWLIVDCPPLTEPVWVDREMWEKIVLNLVSNAFKFTLEGGITVRLFRDGEHAVLSVADTGTGIPPHELPRLFDRFHRVEGARGRTHEGTGIGLALVQDLTKLHGGAVRSESTLGQGSTFTVSVPLGTAHLPPDRLKAARTQVSTALGAQPYIDEALRWLSGAAPELPAGEIEHEFVSEPPAAAKDSERSRILIAEDNADMRAYLRRLLEPHYDTQTVADGAAALAALREERPDLLLSDVMMPVLDGFGLVREVRADPTLADLPVILLSARAGEEASIEGLQVGANDYLIKPFSARELLARLTANLEMARLRREFERRTAADLEAMTRLNDVGNRCVQKGIQYDDCLKEILDAAIAFTGADKGTLQLLDVESGILKIAVHRGFEGPFLNFFAAVGAKDVSAYGRAMQSSARVFVEDVTRSEIFSGHASLGALLDSGVRAVQSTPLVSSAGIVVGMISTHFSMPRRPDERELRLIDLLARLAADFIDRKAAEHELRNFNAILDKQVRERTRELESVMEERRRAEAALQHAQRLEALGQLTGGVAHDFNNLLTVVIAQAELIIASSKGNESIVRMAAAAQRVAERGAQLTSQLLAFARRQPLRPVTVELPLLMANIGDLVRRAVGESITVELTIEAGLWTPCLDAAQFESAILNLAINARDAMPNGGRLVVEARNAPATSGRARPPELPPGDYVVVSVRDTGVGMSPEVLRRAFEPFFTTKDVGKGTGLGLAQIYGFARQSGGTATIDSALGKGTIVAMYFPMAEARSVGATTFKASRTVEGHGRTVLLVEDQADVREVLEVYLAHLGFRTLTAADGLAARTVLQSDKPIDLLVTDVVMPNGVSGLDLAQDARRLRQDIKVVFVSGYFRDTDNRIAAFPDAILLLKPFNEMQLAEVLARALGRSSPPHFGQGL